MQANLDISGELAILQTVSSAPSYHLYGRSDFWVGMSERPYKWYRGAEYRSTGYTQNEQLNR